jgi:hypothetical protein
MQPTIGPILEDTTIDGILIGIDGRGKPAYAQIEDAEGVIWHCEIGREIASRLVSYLFEAPVRVRGEGKWLRTPNGRWNLQQFRVDDFIPMEDVGLVEAVRKIRGLGIRLRPLN